MRSCLHLAVANGQYAVIMSILESPSSGNIMNWKDTKDRTALHFAAEAGNTAILELLLSHGASTAATDLDERTALHIACENNSVGCAEALIHASKGELNDPDIDGMSPLLLASMKGHRHMVKVLTALGADNSCKDDQRRTALMLAAMNGQTAVMAILLENQADLSATDKYKLTALHYACSNNHAKAVRLLLARNADVTATTLKKETPLDLAAINMASEATIAILQSDKWEEAMSVRDDTGYTPMQNLIVRIPEAAKIVMDRCVDSSTDDPTDKDLVMHFNYKFIDPHPDDAMSEGTRWCALETMAKHKRKELLSHPLSQNILSVKWTRFARYLFYANLATYVLFVVLMMVFILTVGEPIRTSHVDDVNLCPIYMPEGQEDNATLLQYYKELVWVNKSLSVQRFVELPRQVLSD
ncbi:transient receptor potential cation channel subfamily A member 1-like [Lineus longissimus]|uniref:transient receptor potential cation channel subfamily A member 1-like n=1 Tax=Lineus longissimus TaxID=88925 RepID=UPI00315E00E5